MVSTLLLLCVGITFATSILLVPWWISRAKKAGLTGIDMHKRSKSDVAEIGGLPVIVSFFIGVLLYLGVRTFVFQTTSFTTEIIASLLTLSLITIIGLVDDILGWKIGLKQWQKPLLCILAALPMMINTGNSVMYIPLLGKVQFGIIYPLLIIPLIITASSNAFNMVAGYNGLEAGMGIIILGTLGTTAWLVQGAGTYAMLAAIMIVAILGFLFYNHYPAKVFPGDTFTYSIGGLAGILAILANLEKMLLILFIPYIIQFFLKSRYGWKKESFGTINSKEKFMNPQQLGVLEDLPVLLWSPFFNVKEPLIVYSLYGVELVMVALAIITL